MLQRTSFRRRSFVAGARRPLISTCAALALLAACGDNQSSGGSDAGASPMGGAALTPTGGASPSPTGGSGGATGGINGAGGAAQTSGGAAPSGGTIATGGTAPGGSAGAGAPSGGGGGGGAAPNGGSGGAPSAGSGGGLPSGGSGGSAPAACTRELLKSTIEAYFEALAAHDPSSLPVADNVKFTEDGATLELGEKGLWKSAGTVKHTHSALDTQECQSATQAVIPDDGEDIPMALRIKLVGGRITEIETIVVHPGDYKVSGSNFNSNTEAMIKSASTVKWEEAVPADQRATREEITSWMDKYFRVFPRGVCNVSSDCKRLENGGGNFDCGAGASCATGAPTGTPELDPRLILADVETGVGVGFTMFMENADMHMFKMYGDEVHAVQAVLGQAGSSGWE
jgi:hypothetical protein